MDWRGSRILITEDEIDAAELLALLFEHQGARADIVVDGIEGGPSSSRIRRMASSGKPKVAS